MAHFPVFMDLSRQKCMIFGGGNVALRKIKSLLKYDADMEVISRDVLWEVEELLPAKRIHRQELNLEEGKTSLENWLAQADLVIAATADRGVNHFIAQWCHQHHILVNVIDAPEECSFLFPSVVKRGDISIGINSGGKSPIVSSQIRKEIEQAVPQYYAEIADQLGQIRTHLREHFPEEEDRRRILKRLAAEAFAKERSLTMEEIHRIVAE